ncbi:hypothetical protein BKA63DRAFT_166673 [Paraphoma chrysanthemicola]|nr:hypothetical protein BKA63DRAFT_166673 [Paraphoma chrysanthemicola]
MRRSPCSQLLISNVAAPQIRVINILSTFAPVATTSTYPAKVINSTMSSSETGLPEGWEVRRSNTKNLPYYFHSETKDSRWEPPAGTDPDKLKEYMAAHHSTKGVVPANFSNAGGKIRVVHLLVKHRDSRRPASWREPKITRSKDDAKRLIEGYETQIKAFEAGSSEGNPKSLSELATTESDCSSARKGGDLGFFGRGDMQKEFEEAAFALQKGEVSAMVDTASGLHLIQRLE